MPGACNIEQMSKSGNVKLKRYYQHTQEQLLIQNMLVIIQMLTGY